MTRHDVIWLACAAVVIACDLASYAIVDPDRHIVLSIACAVAVLRFVVDTCTRRTSDIAWSSSGCAAVVSVLGLTHNMMLSVETCVVFTVMSIALADDD